MILLKPTAAQQADLQQLLGQQQDPASPNYHKWLTPEQYAARFGQPQTNIDKLTAWLSGNGLKVVTVARGRNEVTFEGGVRQVESAFGTEIHNYSVNGEKHFANSTNPSVPAALGGFIQAVHGLDDFRMKARAKFRPLAKGAYTSGTSGYQSLAPDDIATQYDIKPLLNIGITGTNQKIAIVGQSAINPADISSFRSFFNLPPLAPQLTLVPGSKNPGIVSGDENESDLDIEFAGAVARNATVIFVYSTDVVVSVQYAIDNNLAPVISMSYGACEMDTGITGSEGLMALETLAQQGNLQGITWMASAGDSGAADCYGDGGRGNTDAVLAVDAPGSIPEVTSVGGTELNPGNGTYFAASNDADHSSLFTYVPEITWNDSAIDGVPSASGGGASGYFAKPSWQTGTGVPADSARDVPDVAFAASADNYPLLFFTDGQLSAVGGTSVAAPTFAGIVTLLNQYLTTNGFQSAPGLGNINPRLYSLAASVPGAFHDITIGNNIVSGCTGVRNCTMGPVGYNAGVGYDQATGLGSVDAYNMVTSWHQTATGTKGAATLTLTSGAATVSTGGSVTLTATVSVSNGGTPTGTVAFSAGGVTLGTATLKSGSASFTVSASQLAAGYNSVSAVYSGDTNYTSAAASIDLTAISSTVMTILGTTNAASGGQQYSAGEIMAVYGTLLAGSTQSAPTIPLPTTLGGVTVTVNGINAPLFFVSPGQINLQVPYEVSTAALATLTITYNGQSVSSEFPILPASPGIFVDTTGAPAGSATAKRGQTIALYITGQGPVSPQPVTGALPASGTTPVPQQPITITVGGVTASTQYAYEAIPVWAIGLTQINFTVPSGAPLGVQSVVVSTIASDGTPATSPAAKVTITQ
jgi:uncharacterized protein (TIGR03437 family)